jgi:hypothetical protein
MNGLWTDCGRIVDESRAPSLAPFRHNQKSLRRAFVPCPSQIAPIQILNPI